MMTSQRRAGPTTPTESDPLLLGDRRRVTSLARLRVPFDGRHGPELRYAILREGQCQRHASQGVQREGCR